MHMSASIEADCRGTVEARLCWHAQREREKAREKA